MNAAAKTVTSIAPSKSVAERVEKLDWECVSQDLDAQGSAMIGRLLSPDECQALAGLYQKHDIFRSRVVMARHGFGRGEYKYFNYPLPDLIVGLRTAIYPHLVPIANRWNKAMGIDVRYPKEHADFIERCHQAGQDKPTPLLLQYGADDYNCLHQDLYGEHVFPLQLTILLSKPDKDFSGGEFVMTSSGRVCSRGQSLCRFARVRASCSRFIIGLCRALAARIASISGTALAASGRDTVIRSASFSTTRSERSNDYLD